jgi:predicted transcriptional regulator
MHKSLCLHALRHWAYADAMKAFTDSIRAAVTTGGIKKTELAAEAELHRNSLGGVERDDWDPKASTLQKLVDALEAIRARRAA